MFINFSPFKCQLQRQAYDCSSHRKTYAAIYLVWEIPVTLLCKPLISWNVIPNISRLISSNASRPRDYSWESWESPEETLSGSSNVSSSGNRLFLVCKLPQLLCHVKYKPICFTAPIQGSIITLMLLASNHFIIFIRSFFRKCTPTGSGPQEIKRF